MQLADRWLDGNMDRTTERLSSHATDLSFDYLSPEMVHPALRTLIARMVIQENEDSTRGYPGEFNCRIEISDRSGNVFAAQTPTRRAIDQPS
jgi:2-methylcitrate dehydratase PrpD|tara:strand:+ start:43 stop:318 length:276 start_codon:yes stop_codon:yes gene_type:complete